MAEETIDNPLQQELDETKNRLLRCLADFDNFKKRSAVEREQFAQFANEAIVAELLPVLDGLSRAIDAAAKAKMSEDLLKGVALVRKQFEDTLGKHGLKAIEAIGKTYDPNFHEAILQKESDGPEGIVLEETQQGFIFRGRVIRPAMVIVSKKK
ncbi:nucleotide exchange factor GrpE [candidate division WOR-1 bacterium RIFOXYA12_FULL_52_29]|uniref:Protein GrpE n=1 Tax=candidate division WOR-1 bacterium RIFOXYC12_FULL_54_18 TaxID=1802584 RepID=A0A1F4T4U5_UNCSA|nr:MAG: nucleotide exchange factor GrpE [candidate division WOR-1 bacterium RIFOXYA2_FULL_51_19]OGC17082.1 MAG: nucleotide exchange factor GrpE [candidate division WOR-1 bacterium RIFOXYA12_FULL_52_29]OGC25943.1 MAG: nucleotide exchange factor GrpE [candidate division WOR-1 bacterium RIFOXYB2_FULL_45_9]OGC27499.1 MAG: nucleotide exchange factor GrpE [candidate division WOR-1 bacterium RIFOXYC12_FULL_54_18]OGC29288.1 MAG: nucleotide exchange factor GrpE [candidate division WOR-1 bacterium RIFOXY